MSSPRQTLINFIKKYELNLKRKYDKKLYGINYNKLINNIEKYFYQPAYINIIKNITEQILYSGLDLSNVHLSIEERINTWLRNISIISEGAFGRTFKTGILGSDSIFAIKTPLKENTDMVHEYGIGLILNSLRDNSLTPNFVYTYGAFNCTLPIIGSSKPEDINKVQSWCHHDTSINTSNYKYILLENIPHALTFSEALREINLMVPLTQEQILSIIFQIFFSIWIAFEHTGFTHWDLHLSNILLRQVPHNSVIRYILNGEEVLVNTYGYVATIIDFGLSSVYVPNNKQSLLEPFPKRKRHKGYSNPYQDLYTAFLDLYFDLIDLEQDNVYYVGMSSALLQLIVDYIIPSDLESLKLDIFYIDYNSMDLSSVLSNLIFYPLPHIKPDFRELFNDIISIFIKFNIDDILNSGYVPVENILTCANVTSSRCKSYVKTKQDLRGEVLHFDELCHLSDIIYDIPKNKQLRISVLNIINEKLKELVNNVNTINIYSNIIKKEINTLASRIVQHNILPRQVLDLPNNVEIFLTALIESWVLLNELAYYSRIIICAKILEIYKEDILENFNNINKYYISSFMPYIPISMDILTDYEYITTIYPQLRPKHMKLLYHHIRDIKFTISIPIQFS